MLVDSRILMVSFLCLSVLPLALSHTTKKITPAHSTAIPAVTTTHEPAMPSFLSVACDSARKEYVDIQTNMNLARGVKEVAAEAWAMKSGQHVKQAYDKYKKQMEDAEARRGNITAELLPHLSPAARQGYAKIEEIVNDKSLTQKQADTQMAAVFRKLNPFVRKELMRGADELTKQMAEHQ